MPSTAYKRILLKLSGEVLAGNKGFGIDPIKATQLAIEIKSIHEMGVSIGLIIGAGNIFRGIQAASKGMERVTGDYLGMLSTIINAISLQDALEKVGVEKATELARKTVTVWGLSEVMGPINYGAAEEEVFLGKSMTKGSSVSGATASQIDVEIKKLVDRNYAAATDILSANVDTLHAMADALMKYETIDESQIAEIMQGKEPTPPKDWVDDLSNDSNDGEGGKQSGASGEGASTQGGDAAECSAS